MKKILTAMVLTFLLFSTMMAFGSTNKAEIRIKWVKPGENIFEFLPTASYPAYKTTIFYSSRDAEKATLEIRIGEVSGYFSKDTIRTSWPIELKLRTGYKITIGDTINGANNPITIEVLTVQAQGRIKLKIFC